MHVIRTVVVLLRALPCRLTTPHQAYFWFPTPESSCVGCQPTIPALYVAATGNICSGNRPYLLRTLPHRLIPPVPSNSTRTAHIWRAAGTIEGPPLLLYAKACQYHRRPKRTFILCRSQLPCSATMESGTLAASAALYRVSKYDWSFPIDRFVSCIQQKQQSMGRKQTHLYSMLLVLMVYRIGLGLGLGLVYTQEVDLATMEGGSGSEKCI